MPKVPDGLDGYAETKMDNAIAVMRGACDEAERAIRRSDGTLKGDLDAARAVIHELVWGLANAVSQVEGAIAHVERWMDETQ